MAPSPSRAEISNLIALLHAADGVLAIENPPNATQAAYCRAISAAITSGLVPGGFVLRHTGRNRGDMKTRLIRADNSPPLPQKAPVEAIPEPSALLGSNTRPER